MFAGTVLNTIDKNRFKAWLCTVDSEEDVQAVVQHVESKDAFWAAANVQSWHYRFDCFAHVFA